MMEERFRGVDPRFASIETRLARIERQLEATFKPSLPRYEFPFYLSYAALSAKTKVCRRTCLPDAGKKSQQLARPGIVQKTLLA